MIEAQELRKYYGAVKAVDDVSFTVGRGEIVGLLGPNGAGKTTIMKILTGYHYPSGGTALIDGHDVTAAPVEVKGRIGYLPENAPLYEDLTVAEYLDFVADARGLTGDRRSDSGDRALELCGLKTQVDRPIGQLSKGFRQRVGLAQAILHNPDILILDEPTTGLDPNQIQEIRRLIRTLGSDKTVILSTHILQEVEAVCDRVLILNEGVIAASGTTEAIGKELKGEKVFTIELLAGGLNAGERSSLEQIGDVLSEDQLTAEKRMRVRVSLGSEAGGEEIFAWAVKHKLQLAALVPERFSLEDIFTSLTSSAEEEQR